MQVDTLVTFVEVVRGGSFAAVARRRRVAPSSISRVVAALEDELGVRLFHRTTRKLTPTDAGMAYFARIEPLLAELERATSAAADTGDLRGTLRITAATGFAQANIVPLLPSFAQQHPRLSFDLLLTDAMLDLVADRIDLAIRIGALPDSSLVAHRLCDVQYVCCASPAYWRRRGLPAHPQELARHDVLRYPIAAAGPRWRFSLRDGGQGVDQRGDQPVDVRVEGRVVAANAAALRDLATAGMGVVLLPRWNVADELRRGALVAALEDWRATVSEESAAAWLVYPSRRHVPTKVRAFVAFLKDAFRTGPPGETRAISRALAPLSSVNS